MSGWELGPYRARWRWSALPLLTTRKALVAGRTVLLALVPGIVVGIASIWFVYALVFGYYVVTPNGMEQRGAAAALALGWWPSVFFIFGVLAASYFGAHRVRFGGFTFGMLVGIVAAATHQAIIFVGYPPLVPQEALWQLCLGVGGGLAGGWLGSDDVSRIAANEKALFKGLQDMAGALTPTATARAVVTALGDLPVAGIGLWRTGPTDDRNVGDATAVWSENGVGVFDPRALLDGAADGWSAGAPRTVFAAMLPEKKRQAWKEQGVSSAFIAPLVSIGDATSGLVVVGFRTHRLLSPRARRRVRSVLAAASLALAKLDAWNVKRDQDKRLGTMEERERIAREVHDSLIQYMTGAAGQLDAADMAHEMGDSKTRERCVAASREALDLAGKEARRLVRALRPEALDGSSLPEALKVLAVRLCGSCSIEGATEVSGVVRTLEPDIEHALFRVGQEALTNVGKHSGASRVKVTLSYEEDLIRLVVADDGIGTEPTGEIKARDEGGFGMRTMRERIEGSGGRFRIAAAKDGGTVVVAEMPDARDQGREAVC